MDTKVKVTLNLSKKAVDMMLDGEFATQRTQGDFISALIIAHCSKQLTKAEIIAELQRLIGLLAQMD